MNKLGRQYIEKVNSDFGKLNRKFPYNQSRITERMMRLRLEVITYACTQDEYEAMAIATLKEDIIKNTKRLNKAI